MAKKHSPNPYPPRKSGISDKEIETTIQELGLAHKQKKIIDPVSAKKRVARIDGEWMRSELNPALSLKIPLSSAKPEGIQELTTISDISRKISINLTAAGVNRMYSLVIGRYIIGTRLVNLPLILAGSTAEQMAFVISQSLYGKPPATIFIPRGFSDITSLIQEIQSLETECVVVRNAEEFLDESLFVRLQEEVPTKHLLFSITLIDSLSLLSPSIFSYVGILDCEKWWEFLQDLRINPFRFQYSPVSMYDSEVYAAINREVLNKIMCTLELGRGYGLKRAELISVLNENDVIISSTRIYEYLAPLLPELDCICTILGKRKELTLAFDEFSDKNPYRFMESVLKGGL